MPKTAPAFPHNILIIPQSAILIAGASLAALGFAFIMQYGFHVQPCILCLWQRVPFGVAAALAIAAYFRKPYGKTTCFLLGLCAAAFFVGAGLALYHTGVELHLWPGTDACSAPPLLGGSAEDLRNELLNTPVARCDQISWTFLGLSMANWNIPFSLMLAGFSTAAAIRK